jgi:DnaJ domain
MQNRAQEPGSWMDAVMPPRAADRTEFSTTTEGREHRESREHRENREHWDYRETAVTNNETALQRLETIKPGSIVLIESRDGSRTEKYFVRQSSRNGANHSIRLVRGTVVENESEAGPKTEEPDYYDVLQIGPQADSETIYRVYRIMAARFHPDNPETGDVEKFLLLKTAYEVLSDPESRAEYDRRYQQHAAAPMPVFELKEFVTGVEAEGNRRLGVLCLLYNQRRQDPDRPAVTLLDLENRMALPREYLAFTMWYLRAKNFVTAADNSDFTLTAPGAEYVEANIGKSEILGKILFPNRG